MKRKNILLITADQWRGDCLSGLGHPHVKTPSIDALISDGLVFKNHYSVCVPCAPARASLLTGMYLQNHRVTRNGTPLDHRHTNIAQELRKSGYTPKLFGYTDTALDPRHFSEAEVRKDGYEGMLPGFEEGLLLPGEQPEQWLSWLREKGYDIHSYTDAFRVSKDFKKKSGQARAAQPTVVESNHSQTAFLTEKTIEYIDSYRAKTSDSWCIHLSYFRPHPPFIAPQPYNEMYDPSTFETATRVNGHADDHPWLKAARSPLGDWPESWMQTLSGRENYDQDVRQIRATYYGLISKVDHYIGNLINHLKAIDEYNNTLIIFTSDHGELMGDHGLFGKRGYFKESYHIPLVIRDPEQSAQSRNISQSAITESIDLMPTILDWVGSPIPRQCDGRSLYHFLNPNQSSTNKDWRVHAHWEYDFRDIKSTELENLLGISSEDCKLNSISDERYMFVYFASLPALFFDLKYDPMAERNLIDDPKYASLILQFTQHLLTWRMRNDERTLTSYYVSREEILCREN